jgi:hypothetical protein
MKWVSHAPLPLEGSGVWGNAPRSYQNLAEGFIFLLFFAKKNQSQKTLQYDGRATS